MQIDLLYCNDVKSPEHPRGPICEHVENMSLPRRAGHLSNYSRQQEEKRKTQS